MHLKNPLLFGLMAILLLAGTITPGLSQSSFDSKILINEVETNPPGSDTSEFVELYNPTSIDIDVSGWTISPSATWKAYEIPDGTIISSNSFAAFTHVNFWFKDFGETITLSDTSGNLIDETPLIEDLENNNFSWQRTTDGFDTDSNSDWELKRMTPKSSNGKLVETEESIFSLSATLGGTEYVFNETVTIAGSVSEELFTSLSTPEMIKINIQGPNYFKNLALFPDRDLGFSTTLNLQKVLGFNQGSYDVKVSYGEYTSELNFTLNNEDDSSISESTKNNLEISTDKESYIPGEIVILTADTNSEIQYGGLDYTVTNPNQEIVFEGTIFPNEKFSKVFQHGAGELFAFSTQLFMETVNPVYGTYTIEGTYKSQNPLYYSSEDVINTSTSFVLSEDVKEDVLISISTDKEIYAVGDIIKVTGRSNDIWVEDLELRVMQTGILSSSAIGSDARYLAPDPFDLQDRVRLNGDGTFEYEFKIVENSSADENYASSFGDYKIVVSEYFGDGTTSFKVVEDPESFVDVRTPLGLKMDKSSYVLGSSLSLTGKILDYHQAEIGNSMRNSVEITFTDSSGTTVNYVFDKNNASNEAAKGTNGKITTPIVFTAYPDSVGGYEVDVVLHPIQFDYGIYTANALHQISGTSESITFEIKSAQSDIIPEVESQEPLTMEICKSNRAHVDEILKDLKSIGKGEIAPSMESVVCGENLKFNVGDKLVVTGKVIPKDARSLTSTYADRDSDSQTSTGHSYSTNYNTAMMNYVEVSIPYPRSMTVSGASSVTTVPDADENYTGGGGTGTGGAYYEDEDGNIIRGDEDKKTSRTDDAKRTGYDGTILMKQQKILLTDMRYKAYPDDNGNYATVFELRAGVFKDGIYAVKADYFGHHDETSVKIIDTSLKGGLEPSISVNLEKDEFTSGDTVRISGKINNIYYYDSVSVRVDLPNVSEINCFEGQQCGFGNSEKKIRVQEGVSGPGFFWNYKLPKDAPLGLYTIVVDTHFGEFEKSFFVVDESEVIGTPAPEATISKKIIEKFNRISDDKIPIVLTEKSTDDSTLSPRVIQGSLFTSARGEESDVNLRITTSAGQCVIGQGSDCLVTESTRKPGAIYSIVTIDDINYKIRYSGDDVRLEKFSIVPEDSSSKIDIDNWNVEIIKDEQPSRFYYKVSYVALE
ncbi:MAG: lamin tail domain-containing protein [Candidatus Nitrosopelagicus brevis]|nr:lamin tail domain-containing protein [Candidatus Nitrosopelagicus brevis]